MNDLLLLFLGAAYLENLVLALYFDPQQPQPVPRPTAMLASAGALLLVATLWHRFAAIVPAPAQARTFELALAFMTVAIAGALSVGDRSWRESSANQRIRRCLPPLVANIAVLAFAVLDHRRPHPLAETLLACLGASVVFVLAMSAFAALRHRLQAADAPLLLRGAPIQLLTAALMSLAAMGFAGILQ
jgi:electron transport complex protein RnfA